MTPELPEPLVPQEVDLRNFGYMPLDVSRLLTSETWIEASDRPRLGHALISLWCSSWHQVPAGSLPDNDKVLRRLSMCPTPRDWSRIKDKALASWVKCSDGLYYHPVVAEKAIEAWAEKLSQRERTMAATKARDVKRRAQQSQRDDQRDDQRDVHQGKGREGKGKEGNISKDSPKGAKPPDPIKEEIWKTGRALLNGNCSKDEAGSFIGKLFSEYGAILLLQAVRDCDQTRPAEPKAWLVARCQERRSAGGNKQLALEESNRQAVEQAMRNHANA